MSADRGHDADGLPAPPSGRTGWPWTREGHDEPLPVRAGPRISVIVPSFNQGEFIEETLRSLLMQGYPALELIVIDGGSRDRTQEVLARYRPWLAVCVSEPDGGQSEAINKGLARCTGELITFIGSDDVLLEGALAHVAGRWPEVESAGAIVGGFVYVDAESRMSEEARPPSIPLEGPLDLSVVPPGAYRLHQVSTFFVRSALDTVGRRVREDLRYTMDRELLFRVARSFRIVTTARSLGAFRRHVASKSVAETLRFARELARLHATLPPTTPAGERQRRRNARHHLHRGYVKYARAVGRGPRAAGALTIAAVHQPSAVLTTSFVAAWLDALGLGRITAIARTFRGHAQDRAPARGP